MNRKDFFKKLGLGAMVVFTAPKLLSEDLNCSEISNSSEDTDWLNEWNFASERDYKNAMKRHYPLTYDECVTEADYQLNKAMYEEIWRMKL